MKILFVSHEASRTGAPMFLLHFLRWLKTHTAQPFELLLGQGGGPLEGEFRALCPVHGPKDAASKPEFFRGFSLVYANTLCNGLMLDKLPLGQVPVATHVHELDYGINVCGARNMAAVVRHSRHYVACAQIVADRLRHRFAIPEERLSVCPEMFSLERVLAGAAAAGTGDELRRSLDLPPEAFVVAGCGTVDLRKAPDLFVQVAAAVVRGAAGRPVRFVWIGKPNDIQLRSILTQDVRRLGLGREIRFVDELPSPHGLLSLSDVFCVTSREDPFPLVMMEAAALGKPVLCFEGAGGAPEFCRSGGGQGVPFLDTAAMAAACLELMASPERRVAMGRNASALARRDYTVEAIAPRLWREIERLLAEPSSPTGAAGLPNGDIFQTWLLEEAPDRAYVLAHLGRRAARLQARALAASGEREEAIRTLLRALRADTAANDRQITLEGLLHIGGDLAPLDPAKAHFLRSEAEKLAAQIGVELEPAKPIPARAEAALVEA